MDVKGFPEAHFYFSLTINYFEGEDGLPEVRQDGRRQTGLQVQVVQADVLGLYVIMRRHKLGRIQKSDLMGGGGGGRELTPKTHTI